MQLGWSSGCYKWPARQSRLKSLAHMFLLSKWKLQQKSLELDCTTFSDQFFPNLCCFNSSHGLRDLLTSSHMPSRRSPGWYYGQFWELCFDWVWAGGQNSWEKYELQACLWRCLSVLMVWVLRVKSSSPAAFFSGRLYENVKSDKLISQLFSVWRRQTSFWQLITRFSTRVRGLFLFTV